MRIFIAEDEPLAAAKLKLFLEKLGEGKDIVHFGDGQSLIDALDKGSLPDLLFMDIQMPHVTGIEVLKQVESSSFPIILTTAYEQYAIDGFNFGVTDYLLKPYTLERLDQAVRKAKIFISASKNLVSPPLASESSTIIVRSDGRNERVDVSVIECLEADKDYTHIHLTDGRKLTTLGTLSSFEQQVPDRLFLRIQRSYIINLQQIQSYNSQTVKLISGLELPLGKTYKEIFLSTMNADN